ncbi:Cell shape-determining protein MreC precursor [Lacunisphaera limnophila]|uniref:Cell shape-determining protein MreC n=1 Tax=Lacunisphaera limnophila TaxID=1838286 RepID=A0A1D8AZZ4_9BACT|nr:rod shape-determining protein MreC [Lacunisphaera limnophila]AOS46460.1 Cell shape-determining protein MreC precursor [Lacunisphaera limnophila]
MLPRRFDQARPFITLGVILLAWILLPLGAKLFTRASFFEIQAPLIVADSFVRDLQTFWSNRATSKDELLKAGRQLAGLVAQYEYATQQNAQLQAEILRLENLLNLPALPAFRLEPARVARRDFSGWWQRMVIRKGSNHGIPLGAPVVFAGGVVGRVTEVHRYTAVVDLVTSPTLRLAATVAGDTRPVSYQGGLNSTFSAPRGTVDFVPLDVYATPNTAKRLVTSGLGVFPPGLIIGEITRLEPSADGLFKNGEVQLDQRLGTLTEVTVLIPLDPEE